MDQWDWIFKVAILRLGRFCVRGKKKREGGMIVELESACPAMTYAKPYAKGR